jgi:hypothetical protein
MQMDEDLDLDSMGGATGDVQGAQDPAQFTFTAVHNQGFYTHAGCSRAIDDTFAGAVASPTSYAAAGSAGAFQWRQFGSR